MSGMLDWVLRMSFDGWSTAAIDVVDDVGCLFPFAPGIRRSDGEEIKLPAREVVLDAEDVVGIVVVADDDTSTAGRTCSFLVGRGSVRLC